MGYYICSGNRDSIILPKCFFSKTVGFGLFCCNTPVWYTKSCIPATSLIKRGRWGQTEVWRISHSVLCHCIVTERLNNWKQSEGCFCSLEIELNKNRSYQLTQIQYFFVDHLYIPLRMEWEWLFCWWQWVPLHETFLTIWFSFLHVISAVDACQHHALHCNLLTAGSMQTSTGSTCGSRNCVVLELLPSMSLAIFPVKKQSHSWNGVNREIAFVVFLGPHNVWFWLGKLCIMSLE